MSGRKNRWLGLGLVTTAGTGMLALTAMMNSAFAYGDDVGLVIGGSGTPIPGPGYVEAADKLFLDNPFTHLYPNLDFYQATPANPFGNGLFTPEGLYPLSAGGPKELVLNYPLDANGLPALSTSVGQGAAIVDSTVLGNQAAGDSSTVFGYSQSSTLSGIAMQLLDPSGTPSTIPAQFLLIADPSNPNGGLLERFNGFETMSGQSVQDELNLPSLGLSFDGATPANDFTTNIYTLEYDGYADFPRYPLNFLSDLNAFLGIEKLHGTYLNGGVDGSGPTAADIAHAILLPGSEHSPTDPCTGCLTDYHMIDTLGGNPVTPPLVAMLPKSLQELLGPDLTYLINLGYGNGDLGYSDAPANIPTPFGLSPDVSASTMFSTLLSDTQQGIQNLMSDTDPFASAVTTTAVAGSEAVTAATTTAPTFTDIVNAISSAASTAYGTLLPLTDIGNTLVTSLPAYDLSLITANLGTGDLVDAFGLPIAANTAVDTLAAGFAVTVIENAASQIAADFSGL